jgi:regulator of RNase E activity RraB
LYLRGFLVLVICPVNAEDNSELWNVEAGRDETPEEAASQNSVEDLVRLGARFEAEYDGWGTSIDPA